MPLFKYTRATLAIALAAVLGLVACDQDKLLVAPTPDVVLPKDISGPSALPSAYAAAIGDFQVAYAGGYGNGLDNNEGMAQMTGLLADELINAETFDTRIEVDRRATKATNGTTLQTFQDMQRARATADLVASRFRQFDAKNANGAEIQALAAFSYVRARRGLLQWGADEQGERRRNLQLRRATDGDATPERGGRKVRLGDQLGDDGQWRHHRVEFGPHRTRARSWT
jgi:hypothetical protein